MPYARSGGSGTDIAALSSVIDNLDIYSKKRDRCLI